MKRKMILKRITSFVCAMMVLIGAVGGAVPYKAEVVYELTSDVLNPYIEYDDYSIDVSSFPDESKGRPWIIVKQTSGFYLIVLESITLEYRGEPYYTPNNGRTQYSYLFSTNPEFGNEKIYFSTELNSSWIYKDDLSIGFMYFNDYDLGTDAWVYGLFGTYIGSNCTVTVAGVDVLKPSNNHNDSNYGEDIPDITGELGFLTDFSHLISYKRGSMYNYNMDSRTDRWTFDKYSTAGIDLSLGGYSVKHYVRPVLVNGYEDEDVVEKYDKFYDASYDASLGYVQYLDKELESKLAGQGYDGPSWFDKYILGRFVLRWHYFELVDNETGQSDGFARLRPKDADGVNGGTEYWVDYVDENDNVIDGTDGDIAYRGEGSYVESEDEDIEDAFDDAEEDVVEQEEHESIFNLEGVDILSGVIQSFSASMGDFASVISNFFSCLPPWVLTVFGLSVSLTFLGFIIKNLR